MFEKLGSHAFVQVFREADVKTALAAAMLLIYSTSSACTWYGREVDFERFDVYAAFFGRLASWGEDKGALRRVTNRWAVFEPTKVIWGSWSTSQRVLFPARMSSLQLIKGRQYYIHVSRAGQYERPCGLPDYIELRSWESIEDHRYVDAVSDALANFRR